MIAVAINNIRSFLESKVQGIISIRVSSYDVLYIQIEYLGVKFLCTFEDIINQLHRGLTTQEICDTCLRKYTRYICNTFIKN